MKEFWLRVNRAYKTFSGYIYAVAAALCFGWIDSTLKSIDSGKPVQRFSPGKRGNSWCTRNIERCERYNK